MILLHQIRIPGKIKIGRLHAINKMLMKNKKEIEKNSDYDVTYPYILAYFFCK